ncbi:MAG: polyketide synthase, partial [bacterium]|nr:polyketide synthase [bacterium]
MSIEKNEAIAIIGIGCRFPGDSDTPKEFWNMLMSKTDAICDVPENRWDSNSLYDPDWKKKGKISVNQGGFISNIDKFDASFFGIPPIEAMRMDPQQRMLLEGTYMAMEDAGVKVETLDGSRTGVFIGLSAHDYGDLQQAYSERENLGAQSMQGGASSIASNRISYVFNFKGPSFTVDTACSSSLVALHLAIRSIRSGESDISFVGGVNAIIKPEPEMAFSKGGFLSPDCRCKAFDADANGYIRSEGMGIVMLKPLSKALEDGDKIYTTVIGSAINEDGRTPGLAMPNYDSQVEVLRDAYKDAGISPGLVDYVEAHGTGTAVGDPIELRSIGTVIGSQRDEKVYVGSVKSNIGHLEPASGMAGLIKLSLSMKNRTVPPNIHFNKPNPKIDFKELNVEVPVDATGIGGG